MTESNDSLRHQLEDLHSLDKDAKAQFFRLLTDLSDPVLVEYVLTCASDAAEEDWVRMEAWRTLGLAADSTLLPTILASARHIVKQPDEDEDVQNAALQALALLPVTDDEVSLALQVLEGDAYVLVKAAAFALLSAHNDMPTARAALKSLEGDPHFGDSAKRVLQQFQQLREGEHT